ncbi:MAG: hypothetical protein LBJ58_00610 [Tannerellaceae bacterium]|nr:hypothetical protein [Tannerellaceae bacterium]
MEDAQTVRGQDGANVGASLVGALFAYAPAGNTQTVRGQDGANVGASLVAPSSHRRRQGTHKRCADKTAQM